jgi:hypothetical protein
MRIVKLQEIAQKGVTPYFILKDKVKSGYIFYLKNTSDIWLVVVRFKDHVLATKL